MNRLKDKNNNSLRRQNRVRAVLRATSSRPRLSVQVTNRHITAQVIDDASGKTLLYASTIGQAANKGTLSEKAAQIGKQIAEKSKSQKIKAVTLDRGPKLYHGRVKALAEAARKEGLII